MCGCLAGGSGCNTIILGNLTDMSGGQQALGQPADRDNRALCPSSSRLVQGRCRVPKIRKRRQSIIRPSFWILCLTMFPWSYDPKQVTWPSQTEGLEKQTQHPDERSWDHPPKRHECRDGLLHGYGCHLQRLPSIRYQHWPMVVVLALAFVPFHCQAMNFLHPLSKANQCPGISLGWSFYCEANY